MKFLLSAVLLLSSITLYSNDFNLLLDKTAGTNPTSTKFLFINDQE